MTENRWPAARAALGWVVAVVALGFLAASLYQHRVAVAEAFAATPPWTVAVAALGIIVLVGGHLPLWTRLLAGSGVVVPTRRAASVVYVGQLGKYVPGGVWSVVAQASLARELGIPTRRTIGAGMSVIVVQLAGAASIAGLIHGLGYGPEGIPRPLGWLVLAGALTLLSRPVLRRLNGLLSGAAPGLSRRGAWEIQAIVISTWLVGCATAIPLLTEGERTSVAASAGLAQSVVVAFIAGVVMVLAPAGLGVREAVTLSMAGPLVGVGRALAAAVVLRVISAVVDVSAAAISKSIDGGREQPRVDHATSDPNSEGLPT